jgi:hypothetical protein
MNKGKLHIGTDGYVVDVRCGLGHSGNRRLAEAQQGVFACQGCGRFYSLALIDEALTRSDPGQNGEGGLYRLSD